MKKVMHKFVSVVLTNYPTKSWLEKLYIKVINIIKVVLKNYHLIVMLKKYHLLVVWKSSKVIRTCYNISF